MHGITSQQTALSISTVYTVTISDTDRAVKRGSFQICFKPALSASLGTLSSLNGSGTSLHTIDRYS